MIRKTSIARLGLIFIVLLLPASLLAETVFLKNGSRVVGKIVGQSRTTVTISSNGRRRVIKKVDIRRISYDTGNNQAAEAERRRRQAEAERKRKAEEAARKAEEEAARKAAEREAADKIAEQEAANKAAEERRREQEAREAAYKSGGPYRLDAFLRSMVLPGWGQYYQGRTGAAYSLGGAFAAGLGASYYFTRQHTIARSDYQAKADTFFYTSPLVLSALGSSISSPTTLAPLGLVLADDTANARKRMENAGRIANNARGALLAIYLWNLTDVLIFHPSKNESLGLSVGNGQVGVRYSLRF